MSYLFSFNTAPPSGFIIDSQTGLITIADDTDPFSGDLSVAVFDGVTIDVKTISIVLSAPDETPLLSSESLANSYGGGRMVALRISFDPILCRGGGRMVPTISLVNTLSAVARGGQSRTIGTIGVINTLSAILRGGQSRTIGLVQFVPPSGFVGIARGGQSRTIASIGVMAIAIQQGASLTVATGDSTALSAQITVGGSASGVNQAVTWSIVSGTYSGYGSISSSGVLTVTNGAYQATGAMIVVRATSVSNPTLTTTINIYAIDKFTGIQVTPSASTVAAGAVITIGLLLQGLGSDLNGSNVSLISTTVSQDNGTPVTLSGNSVTYTAGGTAGTININSTFFYPAGNYQVQGSATVQNMGAALTVVPSYTVSSVGDTPYGSGTYAALNDADWNTGFAMNTSGGFPLIVVNLGSAKLIKKVQIAGGSLPSPFGATIAQFLNGGFLEYSSDANTWTTFSAISGVVDTTGVYSDYNPNITAQYWRLRRNTWLATSAFMFYI